MTRRRTLPALITIATLSACCVPALRSATLNSQARITRVKNTVQLVSAGSGTHQALVNDVVEEGVSVRTGNKSRGELTFSDQTVVRLAANTSFTFEDGTHALDLKRGAALVRATRRAKGATIHAGGVAASAAGITAIMEYRPGMYKFLVLEGTGRLYRPGHFGDSVLVRPGQMVIGNPRRPVSDPVEFDLARFVGTSCFMTDFSALPSEKLIAAEVQKQQRQKSKKTLLDTNLVIFGGGTLVSLVGQEQDNARSTATAALRTRGQVLTPEAAAAASQ